MEQRRFILFIILSSVILFGWLIGGPMLFPNLFPQPPKPGAGNQAGNQQPAEVEGDGDGEAVPGTEGAEPAAGEHPAAEVANPPQPGEVAEGMELEEFPARQVVLGSLDPESGYFFQVEATSAGGAIETITLNDKRYIADTPPGARREQLEIVGNDLKTDLRTCDTGVEQIDAILKRHGTSLSEVDWAVDQQFVDDHTDPATGIISGVQFRYPSPDGKLEVVKTYDVHQSTVEQRDTDGEGYAISFTLQLKNLSDGDLTARYELTGPVGVPLENVENTRTFIEVKAGIADDPADPHEITETDRRTAASVVKAEEADEVEPWRAPLRYVGVDVQFFAALLIPVANQQQDPYFDEATPFVVFSDPDSPQRSDVSVRMTSRELAIAAHDEVVHEFKLFAGPKRSELLEPFDAEGVINYGWFGWVSVWMVLALRFCHEALRLPYGLAIVLLTFVVRSVMFPFTRKQAKGAKKMKELQPELTKLKEKYSKQPEQFWKAQKELFRKHNYHPMAGCLPLFLQMPIFFGLYRALNMAVDLRMQPFLWIDNLAAPDAMFELPFTVPLLGWTEFNLLPLVTIALWITQQKMFTPPAASEEQAMQQKMMSYMMLFFGVMIYRVPAGLCVYFITSTLWGLTERKLVDLSSSDEKKTEVPSIERKDSGKKEEAAAAPKEPGFFQRLLEAADQAREQTNGQRPAGNEGGDDRKKGAKKRRKSRR